MRVGWFLLFLLLTVTRIWWLTTKKKYQYKVELRITGVLLIDVKLNIYHIGYFVQSLYNSWKIDLFSVDETCFQWVVQPPSWDRHFCLVFFHVHLLPSSDSSWEIMTTFPLGRCLILTVFSFGLCKMIFVRNTINPVFAPLLSSVTQVSPFEWNDGSEIWLLGAFSDGLMCNPIKGAIQLVRMMLILLYNGKSWKKHLFDFVIKKH